MPSWSKRRIKNPTSLRSRRRTNRRDFYGGRLEDEDHSRNRRDFYGKNKDDRDYSKYRRDFYGKNKSDRDYSKYRRDFYGHDLGDKRRENAYRPHERPWRQRIGPGAPPTRRSEQLRKRREERKRKREEARKRRAERRAARRRPIGDMGLPTNRRNQGWQVGGRVGTGLAGGRRQIAGVWEGDKSKGIPGEWDWMKGRQQQSPGVPRWRGPTVLPGEIPGKDISGQRPGPQMPGERWGGRQTSNPYLRPTGGSRRPTNRPRPSSGGGRGVGYGRPMPYQQRKPGEKGYIDFGKYGYGQGLQGGGRVGTGLAGGRRQIAAGTNLSRQEAGALADQRRMPQSGIITNQRPGSGSRRRRAPIAGEAGEWGREQFRQMQQGNQRQPQRRGSGGWQVPGHLQGDLSHLPAHLRRHVEQQRARGNNAGSRGGSFLPGSRDFPEQRAADERRRQRQEALEERRRQAREYTPPGKQPAPPGMQWQRSGWTGKWVLLPIGAMT